MGQTSCLSHCLGPRFIHTALHRTHTHRENNKEELDKKWSFIRAEAQKKRKERPHQHTKEIATSPLPLLL